MSAGVSAHPSTYLEQIGGLKSVLKYQTCLKTKKILSNLYEDITIFVVASCLRLPRQRNFSDIYSRRNNTFRTKHIISETHIVSETITESVAQPGRPYIREVDMWQRIFDFPAGYLRQKNKRLIITFNTYLD